MSHYQIAGKITKSKGLTGAVRARFDKELLYKIKGAKFFFIKMAGNAFIPYRVKELELTDDGEAVLLLDGINTLESATGLVGFDLFIEASLLKDKKSKKERAWESIGGYLLKDNEKTVGNIEGVYNMPGQYIAAVNFNGNEVLVPLLDAFIKDVDDDKKEIYMTLPEGLLDIYTGTDTTQPDED